MSENSPPKKPVFSRLAGWTRKKAGIRKVGTVSSTLYAEYSTALEGSKEKKKKESFSEAMRRQGLSQKDIPAIYERIRTTFFVYSGCCATGLVVGVYFAFSKEGFVGHVPLSVLMAVVLSVGMGVKALEASFRAWQIKTKRLGSIAEYREHGAIIPNKLGAE